MKFPVSNFLYAVLTLAMISSCGQDDTTSNRGRVVSDKVDSTDIQENMIAGIDTLPFSDTIKLKAGADMRFDKELFRIKTGHTIMLNFQNTDVKSPTSMTHNVVILKQGTDIPDFAEEARKASNAHYIPSTLSAFIIAHTNSITGQQSDTITFTIPKSGAYDFICSYPGHWGTMQGKIVAQ